MTGLVKVVVAVVGDPAEYPADGQAAYDLMPVERWNVPYADRLKVELDVSPDDTLGSVLQRAAAEVGSRVGAHVAFFRSDDDNGRRRRIAPTVNLVDDQGRVTFGHAYFDVRYADLVHAHQAGVIEGDPLRPYLILQPGIGNGILPDWHTLHAVWEIVVYVYVAMSAASAAEGTLQARDRLKRVFGKARESVDVIDAHAEDWASRNGEPYDFEEFLDDRPWHPADVAPLLGCSEVEAKAVLWAFGFAPAEGELWRKNATSEAQLASQLTRLGVMGYTHLASEEQLRDIVREEMKHYADTGEARPFDWQRLPWLAQPSRNRRNTSEPTRRSITLGRDSRASASGSGGS